MAKFCRECGNPLKENDLFCTACGAPTAPPEAPQPTDRPNVQEVNQPVGQFVPAAQNNTANNFQPPVQNAVPNNYQPPVQNAAGAYPQGVNPNNNKGNSSGIKALLIVLIVVIVLAVVAVLLFIAPGFLVNKNGGNTNTTTVSTEQTTVSPENETTAPNEDNTTTTVPAENKTTTRPSGGSEISEVGVPKDSEFDWFENILNGDYPYADEVLDIDDATGFWKGKLYYLDEAAEEFDIYELVKVKITVNGDDVTFEIFPYAINYGDGWENESDEDSLTFIGGINEDGDLECDGFYGEVLMTAFYEIGGKHYGIGYMGDEDYGAFVALVRP